MDKIENQDVEEVFNDYPEQCSVINMNEIEEQIEKAKLRFEILKSIVLAVFTIVTVLVFTLPQSKISITSTNENISRERAKLMLEWLKEDDSIKRALAFKLINASYGKPNDGWLRDIEEELNIYSLRKSINPLYSRYNEILKEIIKEKENLKSEIIGIEKEIVGYGSMAYAIQQKIDSLENERDYLLSKIDDANKKIKTHNNRMH